MKRLSALVLALFLLLSLAACGKKSSALNDGKAESSKQSETVPVDSGSEAPAGGLDEGETIPTTTSGSEGNTDSETGSPASENESSITPSVKELKSNDKQCVVYLNGSYVVYGLDGNDIISCTSYMEYDTIDIAKAAYEESIEEIKKDPDVADCKLHGNVIVCEFSKSAWEGIDKTMLETLFAAKIVK